MIEAINSEIFLRSLPANSRLRQTFWLRIVSQSIRLESQNDTAIPTYITKVGSDDCDLAAIEVSQAM